MPTPKMLIIFDDPAHAAELERELHGLSYEVVPPLPTQSLTLSQVASSRADLVILDKARGPDDQLLHLCRDIREKLRLPLVYLLKDADTETIERAMLADPCGSLMKPYQVRELKFLIEMALQRTRARVAVQEQELNFADLLNSIPDAVISADRQRNVTFMNPLAEALTGWQSGDAKGQPLERVFEVTDAGNHELPHRLNGRAGAPPANLRQLRAREGRLIPIEERRMPLRDNAGNIIGTVIVFRDFTELIRSQELLLKSLKLNESLRQFVETLNRADSVTGVLATALKGAHEVLAADRSAMLISTPGSGLQVRAASGLSADFKRIIARFSPWHRSELNIGPKFFPSTAAPTLPADLRRALQAQGVQSLACYPLLGEQELLGEFMLYYDAPHEFPEIEIHIGKILSENISTVLRRLQAQENLIESEKKYRNIFENVAEGIYQSTPDGKFITVNPALVRMLGYSSAEELKATQDSRSIYMDPNERGRLSLEVQARGTLRAREVIFKRKDGSPLIALMNDRAVRGPRGEVLYYEGTLEDITERKHLEDALREISHRVSSLTGDAFFRSLLEFIAGALNVAYALVGRLSSRDADVVETIAFFADGKPAENFSYHLAHTPCENVVAKDFSIYPEDVQRQFPEDKLLKEMGAESYAGMPLNDSKGKCIGLMLIVDRKPLKQQQFVNAVLKIFASRAAAELERILSEKEKEKLESQMLQAQKWESLGVMAGGIAHDFNNLLASIMGNASLALMDLQEDSPARHSLAQIEIASQRAGELTRQLLAYSGKGRFHFEPIRLPQLVREMANLLVVSISKKIKIEFDFNQNVPEILGDPTQIRQIVMNLVTNAAESIGDGSGKIKLSINRQQISEPGVGGPFFAGPLHPGDYVYLEVADSGTGIPGEEISKIFDPFYTTKFAGRGLGLAAVLGIVRGHKGNLTVSSMVENGTIFRILFPSATGVGRQPRENRSFAPARKFEGKVLVIDDEPTICSVASRILARIGFTPLSASNGQSGIQTFAENHAQLKLVLLDMTMPDMDGLEAYRELTRIDSGVPVLLSSGYSEQELATQINKLGLAGFIQKPYHPDELSQKVQEVLIAR